MRRTAPIATDVEHIRKSSPREIRKRVNLFFINISSLEDEVHNLGYALVLFHVIVESGEC